MSELTKSTNVGSVRPSLGPASISLICMFQVVTACCVFFACMTFSPLLAIVSTIVVAPAIIRTGFDSELHRKNGLTFDWLTRIRSFAVSIGVVILSLLIAAAVFALISVAFGILWVCLAVLVGAKDLLPDVAFIGTAGGMIWGLFGGLFSLGICAVKWRPRFDEDDPIAG